MPTIDELITVLQAQRKIHGGNAQVEAIVEGGEVGLATHAVSNTARDVALAAAVLPVAGDKDLAHALYLTQRAMGDVRAARRGRLGHRLIRRAVSKRVMKGLWGS